MPPDDPIAEALREIRISLGEVEAEPSESAKKTEVQIRKRPLTLEEGQLIVDQAATWENTPYNEVGGASKKGLDGQADCSGSTFHIYKDAGFPYSSTSIGTKDFRAYLEDPKRNRFTKIADISQAQPGDLLFWPGRHMGIFAAFLDDDDTRKGWKSGKKYTHNMWTARDYGKPYCSHLWETIRGGAVPEVYRYMIEEVQ